MTRTLRLLLFVSLALYITLGPALAHLFGIGRTWTRGWRMFEGASSEVCKVEYWAVKGGRRTPLDRYRVLGHERRDAPRWLQHVRNAEGAVQVGRRLCKKLGRGADVRAHALCGATEGWRESLEPDQNLCDTRRDGTRLP